jgi:Zn-dependent protease
MIALQRGSFRLFRFAGITVFLHWTWLVVAVLMMYFLPDQFDFHSPIWPILLYLSMFAIVLLHEFGHALACRQVGGKADTIVLWPLGGVAFVAPPPRPEAVLWSIAAGPLVNVVLVPITVGLFLLGYFQGWQTAFPDLHKYLMVLTILNMVLLVFNLLPIYPLDGGQILQSLLWFFIGRSQSLLVVCILGLIFGGLLLVGAVLAGWWIMALLAGFMVFRSWAGFHQARLMVRLFQRPRHANAACPSCGNLPIQGKFWVCDNCEQHFDLFEHRGVCPNCWERFEFTNCLECYERSALRNWYLDDPSPPAEKKVIQETSVSIAPAPLYPSDPPEFPPPTQKG